MNVLPKAIRSTVAHYLLLPIVQNISLFRGVSRDLLFQLDLLVDIDGREQIIGKVVAGESFGEIEVLLGRPQPYVVRTAEISQISCLSRKTFLNILHDNQKDERIIMRNLVQNLQGFGGFDNVDKESDPSLVFNNCSHVSKQDTPTNPSNLISINIQTLEAETKKQVENETECCGREHQIVLDHSVVPKGHIEMALSLSERRWKEDQLDTERGGNKSIHEVLCCSYSGNRSQTGANGGKSIKKRVTIHMRNNINSLQEQNGKVPLISLSFQQLASQDQPSDFL